MLYISAGKTRAWQYQPGPRLTVFQVRLPLGRCFKVEIDQPVLLGAPPAFPSNDQAPFSVAFSFAGERRCLVRAVAEVLARHMPRETIFLDEWYTDRLTSIDNDIYLQQVFENQSELIVVFLCRDYARKDWTGVEARAIRDLVKRKQSSKIMLLRLDDSRVPGFFSIDGLDIAQRSPDDIAGLIEMRLVMKGHHSP